MQPVLESIAREYGVLSAWFILFTVIFMRYAVLAGVVFLIAYVWKRRDWIFWKIQQKFPSSERIRSEILHSAVACAIFATMAFSVYFLRKMGYGALYFDIAERGWGYYIFSIVFMIAAHDTYFYWMHRLMHHPRLFRIFHLVHHQSNNPTPFTAFSFHPLESVVEFAIVPLLALVLPMHFSALLFFTIWSMGFNVMGHAGFEFFPAGFTRHRLFKWMNTPTHHNMHHSKSGCNYSLYFNFWDRVMGTNHREYDATFEKIVARAKEQSTQSISAKKAGLAGVFLLCASLAFGQLSIKDIGEGRYGTPEERTAQADDMMRNGLSLRPEQIGPVHDINLRYAWRTENEVVHADLSDWNKYRKIMSIQKEKDAELKRILDATQFERYAEKRDALFWQAVREILGF